MAGFYLARLPDYPKPDEGISYSRVPVVAGAASWMESLKLPLREVYARYTKSEMGVAAWRSGEISSNMGVRSQQSRDKQANNAPAVSIPAPQDEFEAVLEGRLGESLVAKLDEELDFRKLTGEEVMRFMQAIGVTVGGRMLRDPDDAVKQAYRKR